VDAPKLRNPEWQAALADALPALNDFQYRLNAVSEDIKVVEKILIESGFRLYASVELEFGDKLAWQEYGKGGWRICLVEAMGDNEYSAKPLIEASAAERWRIASSVPVLLAEIASVARNVPSMPPSDDDIPF
jgi:hypothetical protein